MASRDHFRLDVLVVRAAELQQVETELAEVERLLRLEEAGAAGACPSCGSLYARGADYCWHCGLPLLQRRPSAQAQGEAAP
jgi:predicted amidophosphoribosyltransferase